MRWTDILREKDGPVFSFEFFPPRNEDAALKFDAVIDNLAQLNPDAVTVTFGAGGSTKDGSFQIVDKLKNKKGLGTVAYIAGYGLGPEEIVSVLDKYKGIGIETIFVVHGDKPHGAEDFKAHSDSMSYASDLISFIAGKYDFCLGCAGYPEGHVDSESLEKDMEYLKLKVDNGAQYVVAQYVYNVDFFFDFVKRARDIGIDVPILPGIMPIYSVKLTKNLSRICGAAITDEVSDALAKLPPDDKKAVVDYGVDLATEQCRQLLKRGADGLHFYTMNRSKTVVEVVSRLKSEGLMK